MVQLSLILIGLVASHVQAAPLRKRIAQIIDQSTAKWEQACLAAGGGQQCNPVSVAAFTTLLAAAGPCDQQNSADQMIDLAKTLNNNAEMIQLTQIFVQQPRNTPSSQAVQYCGQAPKNSELNGLFHCQFAGANEKVFVGGVAVGQPGTIPLGLNSPVSPPGSCPANPSGPIADGTQLVDITQNPRAGGTGSSNASPPANSSTPPPTATSSSSSCSAVAPPASSASSEVAPPASSASSSTGGFQLQNGKDAQALNAKFATLSADSSCTDGEQACIGGNFAQCVSGKFVETSCNSSLTCLALPLVAKAGTTIACTTNADATTRIAATGATGGITGSGSGSAPAPPASTPAASSDKVMTSASASTSGGFRLQNAKDAQALNAKFATLNANSPCTSGEDACINGGFAQCVDGKFVVTSCQATLTCAALPLVNKPGTSIACTTKADAAARIKAAGGSGGITGA